MCFAFLYVERVLSFILYLGVRSLFFRLKRRWIDVCVVVFSVFWSVVRLVGELRFFRGEVYGGKRVRVVRKI